MWEENTLERKKEYIWVWLMLCIKRYKFFCVHNPLEKVVKIPMELSSWKWQKTFSYSYAFLFVKHNNRNTLELVIFFHFLLEKCASKQESDWDLLYKQISRLNVPNDKLTQSYLFVRRNTEAIVMQLSSMPCS